MESNLGFIDSEIRLMKFYDIYRRLRKQQLDKGYVIVDGKRAINLCSNDYLGLSHHRLIIDEAVRSMKNVSPCSSRLVAGNSNEIMRLESLLARHRNTESSLVYPTGYTAVVGALTALANRDTVIFSDELNHASIIDGCRLSGAKICIFKHNDAAELCELMNKEKATRAVVVTEGVFSITGDIADLSAICKISKEYKALTVVDDAHGDFIFGTGGSGIPSHLKVDNKVDLHISSLSKGLGCFGGYVAGSDEIREFLINKSRQFIFTSALPEHICAASIKALTLAKKGNLQKKLFDNIRAFKGWLSERAFDFGKSETQIIPLIMGQEKLASKFADMTLENGVFMYPMRYPTVKKGSSILRISLTSSHTINQLINVVHIIEKVRRRIIQ
ncbi:MAG TPA: aminotransferase class I/II-fold pyridoxal phosphate-dependent enzyme [Nitrososphaeraceae archaeon]